MTAISSTPSFSFKETGGAQRVLHLRGRCLPFRPFRTRVRQRNDYTLLPGYSQASLTLLGPEDAPVTINGKWSDKWISPSEAAALDGHFIERGLSVVDQAVGSLGNVFGFGTPSTATRNDTVPVLFAGVRVNTASEVVKIFDAWTRQGTLLDVTWGSLAHRGIIEGFETSWLNPHDVQWEMDFKWLGRIEASVAPLLSDEYSSSDTVSLFGQLADLLGLEALPPTFPMANDVFKNLDSFIKRIVSTVRAISDTIKGSIDRFLAPVSAVRRLIAYGKALVAICKDFGVFLKGAFTPGNQYPSQVAVSASAGLAAATNPKAAYPIVALSFPQRIVVQEYVNRVAAVVKKLQQEATTRVQAWDQELTKSLAVVHTVRKGEDLRSISQAVYGNQNDWRRIFSFNNLTSTVLAPGQVILVPANSSQEDC